MKQFEHFLNKVRNRVNESEAPAKLRSVTVEYGDGTIINTSMAAHLSDAEIRDYFKVGKMFNLGNAVVPGDGSYGNNMQPVKNVVINESLNEGLNKSDLVNILEKYTTWLVKGEKLKVANVPDLVNQFMGLNESVNENYNIMVVVVPPVSEWFDVQLTPIIGDTAKSFNYMDKTYSMRAKDIDMFTANVGKSVKFKYDNNGNARFMDFAKLMESAINESQCYYCDTCGDRAEHEEIDENPSMKCSNCGSSEWVSENEYESRD